MGAEGQLAARVVMAAKEAPVEQMVVACQVTVAGLVVERVMEGVVAEGSEAAARVVGVTAVAGRGGGAGVVQTEVEGARGSRQDAAVAEVEPVGEEVGV